MRIYFSASITGGRGQAHIYPAIIEHLRQYGEVLTAFVAEYRTQEEMETAGDYFFTDLASDTQR